MHITGVETEAVTLLREVALLLDNKKDRLPAWGHEGLEAASLFQSPGPSPTLSAMCRCSDYFRPPSWPGAPGDSLKPRPMT